MWQAAFWERRRSHGVVAAIAYAYRRMRADCRGEIRALTLAERQLALFDGAAA